MGNQTTYPGNELLYRMLFFPETRQDIAPGVLAINLGEIPKPDFAHAKHRCVTVKNFALAIVEQEGLSDYWKWVLGEGSLKHDIAQGATTASKLPLESHSALGAMMVYAATGNADIADLVHLHEWPTDQPPDSEPLIAHWALCKADQIAGMGYSGLVRLAFYAGFRHELMDDDDETIIDGRILCDTRVGNGDFDILPEDYELKTKVFCIQHVIPFIVEHGLIEQVIHTMRANLDKYFDLPRLANNFLWRLRHDTVHLREGLRGRRISSIDWMTGNMLDAATRQQDLSKKIQLQFLKKAQNDFDILRIMESIQFLLTNGQADEIQGYLNNIEI